MGKFLNYDPIADNYAKNRSAIPYVVDSLHEGVSRLPESSVILEIGCGTADHIIALQESCPGYVYKGFDISANMLKTAKQRSQHIEFTLANADEKFPYISNSIDYAFMVNVIHHIEKPDIMFEEAARVIRQNGILVIYTDSEEIIRKRSLTKFFPEVIDIELSRYPKPDDLNSIALIKGFDIAESIELGGSVDITDEFVDKYERKCSSSLRIIPDDKHKEGIRRMRDAVKNKERYDSYYLKLVYVKK